MRDGPGHREVFFSVSFKYVLNMGSEGKIVKLEISE